MPLILTTRPGSNAWYIRGTVGGHRIFETTGTEDRKLAEHFRARREAGLYEETRLGRRPSVPFVSAAVAYLDFEPRSRTTENAVNRLVEHFATTAVAEIKQQHADEAAMKLLGPDAAPASKIRHVYTPLIAILSFSAKREWCDSPAIEKPKPPKGKTRWLAPQEALRLLAAAAPHLRPMLLFILCTGARMAEVIDLDWSDVDLVQARVTLHVKGGGERIAALPPAAVLALASLPFPGKLKVRQGRVFRTDDGNPYYDRERNGGGQIKTAWRGACRRAGIAEPILDKRGKPVLDAKERPLMVPTATPHDLRHSWATWFYALARDLLLLKAEGGWATLSMVERYAHLMPSEFASDIHLIWGASHPRIGALPGASAKSVQSATATNVTA